MPPAFNLKIYISIFHMQDFDALQGKSIIQLREIAKSLGIRSTTQMKKDELIQAIIGPRSDEPVGPAGESPEPKPKRQRLLNNTPVRQSSAATDARETAEATANRNDGEETVQETEKPRRGRAPQNGTATAGNSRRDASRRTGRRGSCSGNTRRSTTAPPAAAHGVPDKASSRQNSPTPSAILPERPTAAGRPLHSHSGRCQYRFRGGRRRSGNHARRLRFPPFARLQLP